MVILLLIFTLILPVYGADNDPTFSRDHLRLAHQQWVDLHEASLLGVNEMESDIYGYNQLRSYQTLNGPVDLTFYFNFNDEIYDIGIKQSEEVEVAATSKLDRIISRVLWAATLKESVLVSTLWFVGTGSVQLSYDDRIGNQGDILKGFIDDVQSNNRQVSLTGIQTTDEFSTIQLKVDGKELELRIKPNLNLYLNGQVDVVTQKISASLEEHLDQGPVEAHSFHRLEGNEETFSARFIARDRSEFNLEFEQIDFSWQPKGDFSILGFHHPLQQQHFSYWATRNFPQEYRMTANFSSDFTASIQVEGLSEKATITDSVHYFDLIGWLGNQMLSHTEVSSFREHDDSIETTTYILYFDPELLYQHMIRVRDRFTNSSENIEWISSEMHMLPAIRLDNVSNIYGRSNFPIREYEALFEMDVTN